ncbi:hypothetical protein B296_00006122 [Ensete ventricosum]|uniref:NAC domain-containing protein n=1 Tax=Ensete ventricosum TaxID=4639 RepID=A0A427AA81_ENSVE|nr:hypothetical protein B296_00006122 [Ensete ventricosum]
MGDVSVLNNGEVCMELPPGFRFHPTDEEIITHYVTPKIINHSFTARAMGEVDLNKCEPWDLPSKAKIGGKEQYFFCQRDRKYPTGLRTNRATEAGYWKATGKDKEIYWGKGVLVGMKKTLVFYKGRAPRGEKTNWVMHEFRLEGTYPLPNLPKLLSLQDEWVVCRVFHKNNALKKSPINSFEDDPSPLPLMDPPYHPSTSFINHDRIFDLKAIPPGFSAMMNHQLSSNPPHDSVLYYSQVPPQAYLHHVDEAMLRELAATNEGASSAMTKHCKVEQHSNQSMGCPSQDTGLSTDHNTAISSFASNHWDRDGFDDPWASYGF